MSTQDEKPGAMSQAPAAMCQAAGYTAQESITRRPLSNEEIDALLPIIQNGWTIRDYATWSIRAAERAHGITFPAASAAPSIDITGLRVRVESAIKRITSGAAPMRVPADMTDPDLVLGDVLNLLDTLAPQIDASPKGGSDAPDMFWNDADPERAFDSIIELVSQEWSNGSVVEGDVMEIQQAIRLPNIKVRVVESEDDGVDYEQLQATSAEVGKERCESGSPDCGPVEHWDSEAVPLCARCWKELTNSQSPGVLG